MLGEHGTHQLARNPARLWNVYGWEPPGIRSHVMPDLVMMPLREKTIRLQTNGHERRQFIFGADCSITLVQSREANSNYTDITAPPSITIEQIDNEISSKLNVQVPTSKTTEYDKIVNRKKPFDSLAPRDSLEEGISRIISEAMQFTL